MSDSKTKPVLFSPEQKRTFVKYLEANQMAGLNLEDVISRLLSEEFVEQSEQQ